MFKLQDNSNIRAINLIETTAGALVEISLADAPELDDAKEYLSFSVHIDYAEYPALVQIKKSALQRARQVIAHEMNRLQAIEDAHT